jgi:hypothetical protein
MIIGLLPSNGSTCHIAPSLRLFIPNSLSLCHHSFLSEVSACDVSPSCKLLGFFCGDFSPTAPAAPSLRPLAPSSLRRFQSVQVYHHHPKSLFFFPLVGAKLFRVAGTPTFQATTPYATPFSVSEGAEHPHNV